MFLYALKELSSVSVVSMKVVSFVILETENSVLVLLWIRFISWLGESN